MLTFFSNVNQIFIEITQHTRFFSNSYPPSKQAPNVSLIVLCGRTL